MRLKTLNGAPLSEHLDFSPDTLLDEDAAIEALYGELGHANTQTSTASPLKWRRLAPKETRLRTGWSQPYLPRGAIDGNDSDLSFLVPNTEGTSELPIEDTSNLDTTADLQSELDGFAQHSLIFHETLVSSQIAAEGDADRTVGSSSFISTPSESISSEMDSQSRKDSPIPILRVPSTLALTSLGSLPSANHLRAIYPQMPTPNILCALATPPEDKEIFVKKGRYRMKLREITVADDTRSSFKVTFWSRPPKKNDPQNTLVNALDRVKVGDILLLRNIALSTFRDSVHGQSLPPSVARVKTSVEILMSDGGISSRQLGALPARVAATFIRVRRWAKTHVAPDVGRSRKRNRPDMSSEGSAKRLRISPEAHNDTLPPDTMESI